MMGVKPRGCLHFLLIWLGAMGGLIVWGILAITLLNKIAEQTGIAIDSYGLLFFVPYFTSMILFPSLGAWLGHMFATGRRRSVITSDAQNRSEFGKRLLIHTSKPEVYAALVLAVIFFIAPFIVLLIGKADGASQLFLFVAGPAISLLIFYILTPQKLLSDEPQIVIDERGITNRRWKNNFVPWLDIDQIQLRYRRGYRGVRVPVIEILLKGTQKNITLNTNGLDKNDEEVWEFIQNFETTKRPMLKG